jgi:hypothetical protein
MMQAELDRQEKQVPVEVETTLAAGVDAMLRDEASPIIEFPEDEGLPAYHTQGNPVRVTMTEDMFSNFHRMYAGNGAASGGSSWRGGPRVSDMIPALHGLSSLQVSFGSVSDTAMAPADTVLGKHAAEEQEVQGERRELSSGLNHAGEEAATPPKKGKTSASPGKPEEVNKPKVYTRTKNMAATGHKHSGKLTRPNVWSRQEQ